MHGSSKFVALVVLGAACAACSQQQPATSAPTSAAASAPAVSAIPLKAPGAAGADAAAVGVQGPSLADMLKRPAFATAFNAMDGAASLPAWVKGEGTATHLQHVQVGGKPMLLAHACATIDCNGGQVYLLIDGPDHVIQGVLVQASGDAGASVQQLTWLGKPDADAQAWLKGQMAHP